MEEYILLYSFLFNQSKNFNFDGHLYLNNEFRRRKVKNHVCLEVDNFTQLQNQNINTAKMFIIYIFLKKSENICVII